MHDADALSHSLREHYPIGDIIALVPARSGSGNTYIVDAAQGRFIAKANERPDFVMIHDRIHRALVDSDLHIGAVYSTRSGALLAPGNIVLYEYLPGTTAASLNADQTASAIAVLRFYAPALAALPVQMIHADLGPDNFLFHGDAVCAVIDFTPELAHEHYSLCQFLYWTVLWPTPRASSADIMAYAWAYCQSDRLDEALFLPLLLKAALHRFAGPLIDMRNRRAEDFSRLDRRLDILRAVMAMLAS